MDNSGNKTKWVKIRTDEETLSRWKDSALDLRYMNFSQFVRDAIEEKIENKKENK